MLEEETDQSSYSSFTIIGGSGHDILTIKHDPNSTGSPLVSVEQDTVQVMEADSQRLEQWIEYQEMDEFQFEVGAEGTTSVLNVRSTIPHAVTIQANGGQNEVFLKGLQGQTTVNLQAGSNTVTLGREGSLQGITQPVTIHGGAGRDAVVFDHSAEVGAVNATIYQNYINGLSLAPGVSSIARLRAREWRRCISCWERATTRSPCPRSREGLPSMAALRASMTTRSLTRMSWRHSCSAAHPVPGRPRRGDGRYRDGADLERRQRFATG